jgi:HD superfamily phosphohydrolase YqeK
MFLADNRKTLKLLEIRQNTFQVPSVIHQTVGNLFLATDFNLANKHALSF